MRMMQPESVDRMIAELEQLNGELAALSESYADE
jgi:hypothetical protein